MSTFLLGMAFIGVSLLSLLIFFAAAIVANKADQAHKATHDMGVVPQSNDHVRLIDEYAHYDQLAGNSLEEVGARTSAPAVRLESPAQRWHPTSSAQTYP